MIPLCFEASVLITTKESAGTYILETYRTDCTKTIILNAKGIIKDVPNRKFYIAATNLQSSPLKVLKHTKLVELRECSTLVVNMTDDFREYNESITAIPIYKERIDKRKLIPKHEEMMLFDAKKTESNGRNQINFSDRKSKYHSAFEDMMPKCASKWNGHLEQIFLAKHWTELAATVTRPAHSVVCRVGQMQRQLERDEAGTMMRDGVAKTALVT